VISRSYCSAASGEFLSSLLKIRRFLGSTSTARMITGLLYLVPGTGRIHVVINHTGKCDIIDCGRLD
jgi:hypothetical protein